MSTSPILPEQIVIVIGASAGSIDALERLMMSLPADFAAPLVIAQHLDPSHPSRLEHILKERTPLGVKSVSEAMSLEPGTVYVIPSGMHAEILDGKVSPSQQKRGGHPQPSIDFLFSTAATAYGDRTVGVILSGTGSDGPAGVAAIKEAGGTIVIQDPTGAAYPSLPASIPPNLVDLSTDVESMGTLLAAIASESETPNRRVDHDMLHAFLMQLRARSGIDFTQYKTPTIVRRLTRLMAAAHCSTLSDYMRYLNANPEAYQRLVSSFLIKVTGFFRDPSLYKFLREQVLSEAVENALKTKSELRIWSAGCATGEEPYSIAILVAEILGDRIDEMDIRIFATDLDAESISFARRGLYHASAFTDLPKDLLQKYFTKSDDAYQVKKRIRNLTVFGEYDLGQRAPFPRIDLILCRNVLIYFTKELQQRTLQLFAFSLREGGYLVLGKAETTSPLPQYFSPVHPLLKVFRRHGERLLIPAPTFAEAAVVPQRPTRRPLRNNVHARRQTEPAMHWSLSERLGTFLFDSQVGIIIVDRNNDIQTINQAARQMLEIHGQGIGDDLVHLAASVPAQVLKRALDQAFRGEVPATGSEVEIAGLTSEEPKYLRIACYPEKSPAKDGRTDGVIVLVEDVTSEAKQRRALESASREDRAQMQRLIKQNEELLGRQRSLVEANTELAAANTELRSTNEHLMIAAEEAEASAEEVETLNEEMQATSEELETLNEELQATVEELNTTNEELAARGNELERLAGERQERLLQAEALCELYEGAIERATLPAVVVSSRGHVLKSSASYDELAALNASILATTGQRWKDLPETLELQIDGRGGRKYQVQTSRASEEEHSGRLVSLIPLTS